MIICDEANGSKHDKHLTKFLQVTSLYNLKLNLDKLEFKTKQGSFFVPAFRSEGHKPENDKVQATNKMLQPTNLRNLQCIWCFGPLS